MRLVDLHPHGGLDAGHDGAAADLEIEEDLGAERLHHFDHRVEDVLGRIGAGRHVDVLGPHAQRDGLALVGLQRGGPGGRHGQLAAPVPSATRAPLTSLMVTSTKFMAGEPMKPATNLLAGVP